MISLYYLTYRFIVIEYWKIKLQPGLELGGTHGRGARGWPLQDGLFFWSTAKLGQWWKGNISPWHVPIL